MKAWDEFSKKRGIEMSPEEWLNNKFDILRIMAQKAPPDITREEIHALYDLVRLIREAVYVLREDGRYAWIVVLQKNVVREQGRFRVSGVA